MLGLFGRNKQLTTMETLQLEKDLSLAKQIHYILELEGKICSLDPEFNKNGNLRKVVHRLKTDHNGNSRLDVATDFMVNEYKEFLGKDVLSKDEVRLLINFIYAKILRHELMISEYEYKKELKYIFVKELGCVKQ